MIRRIGIPASLLFFLLLSACVQSPAANPSTTQEIETGETETIEAPAETLAPASIDTPALTEAPAQTIAASETVSPAAPETTVSSTGVPEGEVIGEENAEQIQVVGGIRLQEARLFSWMPDSQGLVVATETHIVFYSLNPLQETGRFNAPSATLMTVSPDGDLIAWSGEDNTLHIWSASAGSEVHTLGVRTSPLISLAFSPDGSLLAVSTSSGDSIELWDPRSGQNIQNWSLPYQVSNLSFSPDGSSLGGVEQASFNVHIWSVPGGEEQRVLSWTEGASPVLYGAYFTPDWKTLAWVARGTVQLMDVATGNPGPSLGHEDFVSAVSLSSDGSLIATAAAGTVGDEFLPVVYLWSIPTGEQIHVVPQEQPVTSLAFSPDGRVLAILTSDNILSLWEVPQ
jgi:WD40 repeat protein